MTRARHGGAPAPTTGLAVDAYGGAVVDPTTNVLDLVEAANKRQDDLRASTERLFEAHTAHLRDMVELRAAHQRALDVKETARLDSIRQVDREDVNKTAASAQTAIATLAQSTTVLAETLRTQVATTAAAAESRLSAFSGDVNKRLSALELSSSEGKGKSAYADPQTERLEQIVEQLVKAQALGSGKQQGQAATWAQIAAGVAIVVGLFAVAAKLTISQPQAVYVPAPVSVGK